MHPFAKEQSPQRLWVVRHGQSTANVVIEQAGNTGVDYVDLPRDADVALTDLGHKQAAALGRWFTTLPEDERPTVVLASPFVRAHDTAKGILEAAGFDLTIVLDERLREQDQGILYGYTWHGLENCLPAEAKLLAGLGWYYYRPTGGENMPDVQLRLHSLLDTIAQNYRGERVLIVCHGVTLQCLRGLLEPMSERELLSVKPPNCSVTSYTQGEPGTLVLERADFVVTPDTGPTGSRSAKAARRRRN